MPAPALSFLIERGSPIVILQMASTNAVKTLIPYTNMQGGLGNAKMQHSENVT